MADAGFFDDGEAAEETYPWSAPQSELWLALQMGDEAIGAYNEQVVFELDCDVDCDVLALTYDKVVNRHPSLRAVANPDGSGIIVRRYMAPA